MQTKDNVVSEWTPLAIRQNIGCLKKPLIPYSYQISGTALISRKFVDGVFRVFTKLFDALLGQMI